MTASSATLLTALAFAAERHRDQRRKDAEASPYINHPIAVATVLATTGGVRDEAVLVAAVLHDTIEDTTTTREELVERFGDAVAALVVEMTDDKSLPKEERKRLQIEHAPHASPGAALLKVADKICNLEDIAARPPAHWSAERRLAYADWAEAVVQGLGPVHPALEARFREAVAGVRGSGAPTASAPSPAPPRRSR